MNKVWKNISLYFLLSFALHIVWENLHAPLYQGYDAFGECFLRCLSATATGDMIFMAIIYLCLALVHKDLYWINKLKSYKHLATWILPVIIGFFIAISFELWAVYVNDRWVYDAMMPIIPVLKVGLTPVLQMIFIPLIVIYSSFIYTSKSK